MLIELSCIPKYRDLSLPGDDVVTVIEQRLYAVFDGATDPNGLSIAGESPGRFAARHAALAMATLATSGEAADCSPTDWLASMNQAVARGLSALAPQGTRAGSTAAVVLDCGDELRFLIVGDSGVRINASELIWLHKDVDVIFTHGRVATYQHLRARGLDGDELEQRTRQLMFKGLSAAAQFDLGANDVRAIVQAASQACAPRLKDDAQPLVEDLLMTGIARGQSVFANRADHSLGYALVNGGRTLGMDMLSFSRPKSQVRSIELFTDGYATCPAGVGLRAWEEEFARVEALDFAKIDAHPSVKGSTSAQFSDDRSVLVVQLQ